jgi:glycosyltransferase involved in cell wall biosynthesis
MRICIAHPNEAAPSETFIRAHIEKLPGHKLILTDGFFPNRLAGKPLIPVTSRILHRCRHRSPGLFAGYLEQIPVRALAGALTGGRIDVVLAEYGPTAAEITEACRQAGVPLVAHFHGFDAYKRSALDAYGSQYPRMFAYASAIISVSSRMCRQLVTLGAPEEKIFYLPCSVDLKMFSQTDPAAAPPHFLAVGRFVEKKAPYLTVLAFREALLECPEARLTMAGDGPLLDCSKQLSLAVGAAHAIEFAGVIGHAAVAGLMKSSRAFLQHSITPGDGDSEGTPVSVLEAAATGLPVIGTDHAGISEAVINGQTGLLVEERDIAGMARHIAALARDPGYATELGGRAREHVGHRYASDRCIARLAAILEWAASGEDISKAPGRTPEWWGGIAIA